MTAKNSFAYSLLKRVEAVLKSFNNVVVGVVAIAGFLLTLALERRADVDLQTFATETLIDRAIEISVEIELAQSDLTDTTKASSQADIYRLRAMYYVGEHRVEAAQTCLASLIRDLLSLNEDTLPPIPVADSDVPMPPAQTILLRAAKIKERLYDWRDYEKTIGLLPLLEANFTPCD